MESRNKDDAWKVAYLHHVYSGREARDSRNFFCCAVGQSRRCKNPKRRGEKG